MKVIIFKSERLESKLFFLKAMTKCSFFPTASSCFSGGIPQPSQTGREIKSLKCVLGLFWGVFPVGHASGRLQTEPGIFMSVLLTIQQE